MTEEATKQNTNGEVKKMKKADLVTALEEKSAECEDLLVAGQQLRAEIEHQAHQTAAYEQEILNLRLGKLQVYEKLEATRDLAARLQNVVSEYQRRDGDPSPSEASDSEETVMDGLEKDTG